MPVRPFGRPGSPEGGRGNGGRKPTRLAGSCASVFVSSVVADDWSVIVLCRPGSGRCCFGSLEEGLYDGS
jgi:hypothetical protein